MTEQVFIKEEEHENQKQQQAEQDVQINETINASRTMIDNIRKNEEISNILAGHGYDEERLSEGLTLCDLTRQGFHQRGAALTAQYKASADLNGREKTARQMYADFRLLARGLFPDEPVRSELALTGKVPHDRTQFLGIARMSVDAARREPYASRFAEFGYDAGMLDQISTTLDALDDADSTQNNAIIDAVEATKNRDRAYAALTDWLKQFRRVATAALRQDPEKLKILEA